MKEQRETVLEVSNMTCGACARHVREALLEVEGVSDVDVRLGARQARVLHDPATAPEERLVEALGGAGYPSSPSPSQGG